MPTAPGLVLLVLNKIERVSLPELHAKPSIKVESQKSIRLVSGAPPDIYLMLACEVPAFANLIPEPLGKVLLEERSPNLKKAPSTLSAAGSSLGSAS